MSLKKLCENKFINYFESLAMSGMYSLYIPGIAKLYNAIL